MLNTNKIAEHKKTQKIFEISLLPIFAFTVWWIGQLLFYKDTSSNSFWQRSELYWHRLIWLEVIISFCYSSIIFGVLPALLSKRQQTGAGYVGMAGTICQASLSSMFLWIVGIFLPINYYIYEICLQIVIGAVALFKIYFVFSTQRFQNNGMALLPQNIRTPDELCVFLGICAQNDTLDKEQVKMFQKSKELIKYSLPKVGNIAKSDKYRTVSQNVQDIYDNLLVGNKENLKGALTKLINQIQMVISECKN